MDVNPARVLGLYPELVSGRFSVPQDRWVELFGGKEVTLNDHADQELAGAPCVDFPERALSDAAAHSMGAGAALSNTLKTIEGYFPISGKKISDDTVIETRETAAKEKIKQKPDGTLPLPC